jgi:hypothetical protein
MQRYSQLIAESDNKIKTNSKKGDRKTFNQTDSISSKK